MSESESPSSLEICFALHFSSTSGKSSWDCISATIQRQMIAIEKLKSAVEGPSIASLGAEVYPMFRMRKSGIVGLIVAAITVAVVVGWVILRHSLAKPHAIAAGGIRITVEGITYGTNHHFSTDSPLTAGLRRVLPASLQRLLP